MLNKQTTCYTMDYVTLYTMGDVLAATFGVLILRPQLLLILRLEVRPLSQVIPVYTFQHFVVRPDCSVLSHFVST